MTKMFKCKQLTYSFKSIFITVILTLLLTSSTYSQRKSYSSSLNGDWKLNVMKDESGHAIDFTSTSWENESIFAYLTFTKENCVVSNGVNIDSAKWIIAKSALILNVKDTRKITYKVLSKSNKELVLGLRFDPKLYIKIYYKRYKP